MAESSKDDTSLTALLMLVGVFIASFLFPSRRRNGEQRQNIPANTTKNGNFPTTLVGAIAKVPTTPDKGTESAAQQHPSHGRKIDWHLIVQILIFGTTLVIARIYYCQLQAMNAANKINSNSLVAIQRAFLEYRGINLDTARKSVKSKDVQWMFSAIVENSGATPITNKIQNFAADNTLSAEPSEAEFVGDSKNYGIGGEIGPKSQKGVGAIVKSDEFILGNFGLMDVGSAAFIKYFQNRRIFFWGWVVYRDAFPNTPPRLIEFCEEVKGVGVMLNPPNPSPFALKSRPNLQLGECRYHNCIDEYCQDYKYLVDAALSAEASSSNTPWIEKEDKTLR